MMTGRIEKRILCFILSFLVIVEMIISPLPASAQAAAKPSATSKPSTVAKPSTAAKTSVTVSTQKQLTNALADQTITKITIKTSKKITFTISDKSYKGKTIVINAPEAVVNNSGVFRSLSITNASKWTEKASGNQITVTDKKVTISITEKAALSKLTFKSKNAVYLLIANGKVDQITVVSTANLTIAGTNSKKIEVKILAGASDTKLNSSIPVAITTAAQSSITLNQGAEKSTVNLSIEGANVIVVNHTAKSVKVTTPKKSKTVAAGKSYQTAAIPTQGPDSTDDKSVTPTPPPGESDEPVPVNAIYYTVTYVTNGGSSIAPASVIQGGTIKSLPVSQKSNNIFLGWYTDTAFENEFTENTPVSSNITLYARYMEVGTEQKYLDDTYTLQDQSTSLQLSLQSSDTTLTADTVKTALTLTAIDGSQEKELLVTGSSGSFLVSAVDGFNEGGSYTLKLENDNLSFAGQDNTIRECDFTIARQESYDIEFNDGMIYIPVNELTNIIKNGASVTSLTVSVVSTGEDAADSSVEGSFVYRGSTRLNNGNVLCIYSGNKPEAADNAEANEAFLDDSIAYVKVSSITGDIGSQSVKFVNAETDEVLQMPDVLPFALGTDRILSDYKEASDSSEGSFIVAAASLDFSQYSEMGLTSDTMVEKGDYLVFYYGDISQNTSTDSVTYGKVTSITEDSGNLTVTFRNATSEDIKTGFNYYSRSNVDSDTLLENVDVAALENQIEEQVKESNFAEESSVYLTSLALNTDGFQDIIDGKYDLEDLTIRMEDGSEADANAIQSMSVASALESLENLEISASIGTGLKKLSGSGLRCAVTVSFDIPIEVDEDENSITISISATFIEEIQISVGVSGDVIVHWYWFVPVPEDYQIGANIDVYNYTGVSFEASVATEGNTVDISDEIEQLMTSTDEKEIFTDTQELFNRYQEIMENETDWIDIVNQNIVKYDYRVLYGIVVIHFEANFVISGNVNLALGCNMEYTNGTRYSFWVRMISFNAGSNKMDLMDEQFNLLFYVMGTLGLKAGINLELSIGLIDAELDSIGITADAGLYTKLYGCFYYKLESGAKNSSTTSGALYLEIGIYLEIAAKAHVGNYEYNPTLYEQEWPLYGMGCIDNVYDFAYTQDETPTIQMENNQTSSTLPDSLFEMNTLNLKTGEQNTIRYPASNFLITLSNPSSFGCDGTHVMIGGMSSATRLECDITLTYKYSTLAFSSEKLSRTFHVVWNYVPGTVSFDSMGGSPVISVAAKANTPITVTNPTKKGYAFYGWYHMINNTKIFEMRSEPSINYCAFKMPSASTTLYAAWEAIDTQYTVEYYEQNLGNDNYTLQEEVSLKGKTDANVTAPPKAYEGFTEVTTADTKTSGTVATDGSLVLKRYYNRNSYQFIIHANGGGEDITQSYRYGQAVYAPDLIRTGYYLSGYTPAAPDTMPASNLEITAKWTANTYSIYLNSNGGTPISTQKKKYNTAITAPTNPKKTGYTFAGWYLDSGLTSSFTFSYMPPTDITLYAKWAPSTKTSYHVLHYQADLNNTNYVQSDNEALTGTTDTTVLATVKSYKGFTCDTSVSGTVSTGTIAADGSLILKLYYKRNSYTMSFNSNGGSSINSITKLYDTPISAPTPPVKTGYTFAGWYADAGLTSTYVFTGMPSYNVTLYAKWAPGSGIGYKVEYYQANTDNTTYQLKDTQELTGTTESTVTAEDKSYAGFTKDTSVSDTASTGTVAADASLVLKLYYKRNAVTISFDSNGGTSISPITQLYGTTVTAPLQPVKTGYNFTGWYSEAELTNTYSFSTMPSDNITVYAKWDASNTIAYKVEHYQANLDNATYQLMDTEVLTGTTDAMVSAVAKSYEGFTEDTSASGRVSKGAVAADGSLVLKLYYKRNTVAIGFDSNGGTSVSPITQLYGTAVTVPAQPVKTGYNFAGWYEDAAFTNAYTFTNMPSTSITLYASWAPSSSTAYRVKNYLENVDGIGYSMPFTESYSGTTDETVTAQASNYMGYTCDLSVVGTVSTGIVAADGSLLLKLYYKRNISTISFETNGGTSIASISQRYGSKLEAPMAPTRTGYTFAGWYSDAALTTEYTFLMMPAANTTLYAKWTGNIVEYHVKHYTANEDNSTYEEAAEDIIGNTAGEMVTATASTDFGGYVYDATVNGTVASGMVEGDGSLVLKLYYKRISYSLTFNTNGGEALTPVTALYGGTITLPTPVKKGCAFDGWYEDAQFLTKFTATTMPAANITLYAKWVLGTEYAVFDLMVGGVQVTTDNRNSITGSYISGAVSFDPLTNTLTLNNATITGDNTGISFWDDPTALACAGIIYNDSNQDLTIHLVGENHIKLEGHREACYNIYAITLLSRSLRIEGDSTSSMSILIDSDGEDNPCLGITLKEGSLIIADGAQVDITIIDGLWGCGILLMNEESDNILEITDGSALKLYDYATCTSNFNSAYMTSTIGIVALANGGSFLAASMDTPVIYGGRITGADTTYFGYSFDGSDATLYEGDLEISFTGTIAYVHAVANPE